jgi:hypothetical protein
LGWGDDMAQIQSTEDVFDEAPLLNWG